MAGLDSSEICAIERPETGNLLRRRERLAADARSFCASSMLEPNVGKVPLSRLSSEVQ
jgi:hypothetical protein